MWQFLLFSTLFFLLSTFDFSLIAFLLSPLDGVSLIALAIAAGCSGSRASPSLAPCLIAGVHQVAQCGTILVYENRTTRTGRRIPLRVVVLPARRTPAAHDPVVFLTGGPGLAATADAEFAARILAPLHDQRDIVLVDQRGTGHSAPLECHLYDDGSLQASSTPPLGTA